MGKIMIGRQVQQTINVEHNITQITVVLGLHVMVNW